MSMYSLVVDIQRTVLEKYVAELEAENLDEALDIAYEHFSEFPNSDLDLKVRRKTDEETISSNVLYIDHQNISRSANDGPEIA